MDNQANPKRGMALLSVVIITSLLTLIVGSLLRWGLAEHAINERHFVVLDARNAAESALELGVAQLSWRWETQTSFTTDELAPANRPLVLTDGFESTFHDSRYEIDLHGGVIEQGRFYVDPNDPMNTEDPLKGKLLSIRSVDLYSRAVVSDPLVKQPITVYARQTLQLRDAPLFSHAIFYNMDLEFHPGPDMTMSGPVHANGDIWVQAINGLDFLSNVTATNRFLYGYMLSNSVTQTGNVRINNGRGGFASPYRGNGSRNNQQHYWHHDTDTWRFQEIGFTGWSDYAINRWAGNVQDSAHDVPVLNPIGYRDYQRDDPTTTAVDDALNYAYALIEPNLPARTASGFANPVNKGSGEREKFSYKANMIIRLHYSSDGTTQHDGSLLPANAVPVRHRVQIPADWRADSDIYYDPWIVYWGGMEGLGEPSNYHVSFWKVNRSDMFNRETTVENAYSSQRIDDLGNPMVDAEGNPIMTTLFEVEEIPVQVDLRWDWQNRWFNTLFAVHQYAESDNKPTNSLYNRRSAALGNAGGGGPKDLFEFNVGAFAQTMNAADGYSLWRPPGAGNQSFTPANEFNGIVYVELPVDPKTNPDSGSYQSRRDRVVTALPRTPRNSNVGMGVILANANTIPNPWYNQVAGRDPGFTFASNGVTYVLGHYNADGQSNTGSSTAPDNSSSPNPPAAIIADAVYPLSPGYRMLASKNNSPPNASGFTEFNAAIVNGLRPTDKGGDNRISGGAHNFPRFLENWGNSRTFRYRGSMVALFESEVDPSPTNTSFYNPPRRDWGFYTQFGLGNYPPGTPNVRSFRKMDLRFLTEEEYTSALASLFE